MNLRQTIRLLQETALTNNMRLIIVGGAIVRLFGPQTAIKQIDEDKHIILLDKALSPDIMREEDKKTSVDIDCIAFSTDKDPFTQDVRQNFEDLLHDIHRLRKDNPTFPAVSIEPVLYHPFFSRPNTLMQFVSSIESYHPNNFFFRLGGIKEDVQKKSLEPWTLSFTDDKDTITTFAPTALQKRYAIRGFNIKPKDVDKIFNPDAPFSQFVANFRVKTKGKYDSCFSEWDTFAKRIQTTTQPSMVLKRTAWNIYWQTIGTYLAHGTGTLGKLLLPLGNTFFAGK